MPVITPETTIDEMDREQLLAVHKFACIVIATAAKRLDESQVAWVMDRVATYKGALYAGSARCVADGITAFAELVAELDDGG